MIARRWTILFLLFLAIAINILDRQVLSLAAPVLRDRLGLSNTQYGIIVFAFLLGMTLGQIPVGTLLDRLGARFGFTLIISWWSVANLLHGLARSLAQFSILRFLLGIGECGTYSGGVKVIGQLFPPEKRALAAGIFNSGSLAGSILAPPVIVYTILHYGWPAAFLIPSSLGLLWIIPWLRVFRYTDKPQPVEQNSSASPAPRVVAGLLRTAPVWGVILMRAFGGPVTQFYWYWLPEYLKRGRGMSLESIGMLAWIPFFMGGLGNIGGGWFSSRLISAGWTTNKARKTAFILATVLCLCATLVPAVPTAGSALFLIALATFGINAFAANLIALLTDIFPESVLARVGGLTGVGEGVTGMLMMLFTGVVIDRYSYLPVFLAVGALPVLSIVCLFLLVGRIPECSMPERGASAQSQKYFIH